MPDQAIQIRNLGKVYPAKAGAVTALEDLNLSVAAGQIFGLLGPNGAGKTTTVRMLCGVIRPTTGDALVNGLSVREHPDEVRRNIGLVPEDAGDHANLTLLEELEYHGVLYGLDPATVRQRSAPLVQRLGLQDRLHHRLKTFSKGMRRKFHLIRALLHEPRILLLDEPTAGLDPAIVEEVWDLLKALASERQVTVILCSHHLEEVERLCTRVAILNRRLLVQGTIAELSGGQQRYRIRLASPSESHVHAIARFAGVARAWADQDTIRVELAGEPRETVPALVRRLVEMDANVLEVAPDGRDLRSLYRSVVDGRNHHGGAS